MTRARARPRESDSRRASIEFLSSTVSRRVDDGLDLIRIGRGVEFIEFIDTSIHSRAHGRVRVDGEEEAGEIRAYIVAAS